MKVVKEQKPEPFSHDVHKCIGKIFKQIKKNDPTINTLDVDCSSIVKMSDRHRKATRHKTGQPCTVERTTNKGKSKRTRTFIGHVYCPFCGKKF